ncbi:hypothetical protein [Cohnella sp. GCM10027633]|uniref:hypothetical protein n=1 Tax=unclassified Cohnella TaxID=2636738 RepID=UPI003640A9D0
MFKWVSWALRIGATAVLLSFLCIWTTGYIVNSYMETIIKQLDLPLETKPFALSGVWGTLWGADKAPSKEAGEETQTATRNDNEDDAGEKGAHGAGQPSASASTPPATNAADDEPASPSPSTNPKDDGTVGASSSPSQQAEPGSGDTPGDAVPVTGEIDEKVLTDAERQALYATVVSKLDPDQLQLLSEALEGGATAEKLGALKEMLQTTLTESEYAQMMEVLEGAS